MPHIHPRFAERRRELGSLRLERHAEEYRLHDIQRLLRREDLNVAGAISLIRRLTEHDGFPPPISVHMRGERRLRGPEAVQRGAIWSKPAVDAWRADGDETPPPIAGAVEAANLAAHGSALDERARLLFGGARA
ncbi:hypothetical protein FHS96_004965 [Sphingomonas zeicaulis]|uniref:hypothetical protein n=1 Tax=Sphingomonas zeicaulis TaxID=1632740 RepID=UPI003D1F40E7